MAMIQLDLNPPPQKLRQFGLIAPIMLLVVGLVLRWRLGLSLTIVAGLCFAGILLLLASRVSPRLVRPIYVGLAVPGYPIGWVVSHLVLLLFYFGIITPLALIFRLFGRDVLHRRWDRQRDSYWTGYPRGDRVERYFRQF